MADLPLPNKFVGYAHGILFIAYLILALVFCIIKKWGFKRMFVLGLASLLPFATFYVDKKYLSKTALQEAS